jgi:hypothetical protein
MPGSDHVKVFNEYKDHNGEKDGFIGVLGFTEDAGRLNLKSGTFNFNKVLEWPAFEEQYCRNYGSRNFVLHGRTKPRFKRS